MKRGLNDRIVWDGNDLRKLRWTRTGVIEGWILYGLTAALPGLSNTAIGALTVGLSTAIPLAGQLAVSAALAQKPPTPQAQDVQANISQALSARRRPYGRTKVGSVRVFGFRRGEFIYILHYIGEGPIEGYVDFFLDRKLVEVDEDGWVTSEPYWKDDRSRMQLITTLGTMADEPFAEIITAFPELDRPMQPFRHRGCAMVLQILEEVGLNDITQIYPNNVPSLEVLLDGLKPYDPRSGLETWTENAGLCLLTETMVVCNLSPADTDFLDLDGWGAFANHCDEAIPLKAGGTEPRYRCAGTVLCDAENEQRMLAIANICNADVHFDRAGRITVSKRLSATPSITLSFVDGDHLSIVLENGRHKQKKFNAVKVVYVERAQNWKENEAYYRNAAAYAEDGDELVQPLDAKLCPSGTQAQRLGKLYFHEMQPAFIGPMMSGVQALELMEDPVFTLDTRPEDELVFVARAGGIEFDAETQVVSFQWRSVAPDAETWDPETEEQKVVEVGPALPNNVDDIALDVTVTVQIEANSAPILVFSWVKSGGGPIPDAYSQLVEVSATGEDDWYPALVTPARRTARFGPVADNQSYDWRIRNVRGGKKFDWQMSISPVTVIVDAIPPEDLLSFSPIGGAGIVTVNFTTDNDPRLVTVAIYLAPTGVPLVRPTHQKARPGVAPGVGYALQVTADAGIYDCYAEPMNRSSVPGTLEGPVTVTVT